MNTSGCMHLSEYKIIIIISHLTLSTTTLQGARPGRGGVWWTKLTETSARLADSRSASTWA